MNPILLKMAAKFAYELLAAHYHNGEKKPAGSIIKLTEKRAKPIADRVRLLTQKELDELDEDHEINNPDGEDSPPLGAGPPPVRK